MSIHSADTPFRRGAETKLSREKRAGSMVSALPELAREVDAQKELFRDFENADARFDGLVSRKRSLFAGEPATLPPLQPSAHNRWRLLFPGEQLFVALAFIAFVVTFLFLGGLAFIKQSEVAFWGTVIVAVLALLWLLSVMLRVDKQSYLVFPEYGD